MLESSQYTDNAFATLTYAQDKLPVTAMELPTLAPEHLRNFLKRLRKEYASSFSQLVSNGSTGMTGRLRFYAVGEYGETTHRPHYHAALFNFPTCQRGRTHREPGSNKPLWQRCCSVCRMVGETWGHGDIDLGILETSSAQYVAGYVTKKLTHRNDFRLKGREPEFARMSNRPGIGADALWEVADTWLKFNLDTREGDVPVTLRHGSRQLPLGRYLRRRLRKILGKEENTPEHVQAQIQEETRKALQVLHVRLLDSKTLTETVSISKKLRQKNAGEVARFHSLQQIYKQKRHL